jgi:hypothetical protein
MAKVSTQQAIKNLAVAKRLIREAETPEQVRRLYDDWLSRVAGSNDRKRQLLFEREGRIDALEKATKPSRSGLDTMSTARAGNVSQGGGMMQRLMRERQQAGRVSGPGAGSNYAKTGRSG